MEVSEDDRRLHHHQQYQQQAQQSQHILQHQHQHQHDKTQQLEKVGFRRGLLKVSIAASPLHQIQAPPCNIRSIAVANVDNNDEQALVYLGTDSGDLYLFTWHRIISSPSAASSLTDSSKGEDAALSFTVNKNLGLSPVDSLCPLPRAGAIAALLDKQVVVLDLLSLSVLEWLPASKGAFTFARAYGSLNSLQGLNGSKSSQGIVAERVTQSLSQPPRRSVSQGQLGRLFGSGRLLAKRGGPSTSSEGLGTNVQSAQNVLSVKKKSMSTLPGIAQGSVHDKFTGIENFVVAVKQRLLLYTVNKESKTQKAASGNGVVATRKLKEMLGPEEVVTMAWIENVVITGTYQEFMLFSVIDGRGSLLFSLPQDLISPPLLKVFPKELEVLLVMDAVGVAVNAAGDPTSSTLSFKEIPDVVGQSSAYVVVVKRGMAELLHRKTGAKVQSILLSDAALGPNLVSDGDDGKCLVLSNAFKVYCLERVPLDEQLKELLRQKQFDEAVSLAEECTAEADVDGGREKLSVVHAQAGFLLFFDLRFKESVDHFLQSSALHPAEIFPFFPSMTNRWRSMVPRIRYWGLHPPPQSIQNVIENKLRGIQRGLALQSVSELKDLPNGHDGLMPTSSRSKSSIIQEYTMQAMKEMMRYLKAVRSKPMDKSTKEGVDTLLLQLFLKLGATEEMECFAASENSCLVEEVEDLLKKSGKLRTLAFLYETKGIVEQALQVWHTLAEGDDHTMHARKLQEMKSTDENQTRLESAGEAARLLEGSSDGSLVLTHLKWILKVDQDLAIQVLSSSRRERPIPPDEVLLGLDLSEVVVRQRYLQWLVQEQNENDSQYHTLFAVSLAKSALQSLQNPSVTTKANEERELAADGSRGRLQEFLESSDKYDPSTVLALILDSDFWREQAILHRKLGNEVRVFQILALKLGDIEAAERFCTELGRPDAYMRLLDMYLRPGEGRQPMYDAAVHLLQLHGNALDPVQVLEALSPDMPFQLAYGTISRMFRSRAHTHYEGQIVRHLTRAENFEARLSRLEQRGRHILVTDHSSCGSCHSRFGTKLFALYPNGSAVCYKCFRNSGSSVDPVTGQNFEEDPLPSSLNG